MRVSISPKGSLIAISRIPPLPARLDHAGDLPGRGQLAQRNARQFELAIIRPRTARQLAPQAVASGGRIARQLRQLETRRELLLDREILVVRDGLEPRALGRVLLRH